ncbi:zinc-ribbon domain-containing protein, partial [Actinophytocola sp.]|uniref:zinc-ribbon domain-containing protein n=1 Tax=Actinophytocola sp. TaxID=1872138 RepID=UPI002EDAAF77
MIIYGWKQYLQVLAVLQLVCSQCGNSAEHVLRKITTKFTLFWIPLFPIGRKHTLVCAACECEQKVSKEQAMQLAASGGGMPGPGMPAPGMPAPQPATGPQPSFGPPSGPQPAYGPPAGAAAFGPGPQPGYGPPNTGPQPSYGPPS